MDGGDAAVRIMTISPLPADTAVRRFAGTPGRRLAVFAVLVVLLGAATVLAAPGRDVTPFVLVLIPPVAALLVTATSGGSVAVTSLFGRMGRWRVGWPWYLAAIGIPVAEKLVVDLAGVASGATTPDRLVGAVTGSALIVPLVVLVPALLEELGWRGFGVQTAVDGGRSPAWAAAVVGVVFVLLHVPLYLPGQLYDGLPWWPLPIIIFAGSVLLTWIYLRTGSALLAGLMHAAMNATVPLTWGLDTAWAAQARAVVLAGAAVLVLVVGWDWWLAVPRVARSVDRFHDHQIVGQVQPGADPAADGDPGGLRRAVAVDDRRPERLREGVAGLRQQRLGHDRDNRPQEPEESAHGRPLPSILVGLPNLNVKASHLLLRANQRR
jgi:uncharacterized protein